MILGFWAPECLLEVPIYLFTGRYLYSWRSKGLIRAAGPKCRVHLRSSGLGRSYKFTWLHGEFEIKKNLIKLWKLKILSGSILGAFKVNLLSIVRKYCCLRTSWIRSLLKFYYDFFALKTCRGGVKYYTDWQVFSVKFFTQLNDMSSVE